MLMYPKWGEGQYRHEWRQIGVEVLLLEMVHCVPCAAVFHCPIVLPQEGAPLTVDEIIRTGNGSV